LGVLYIRIFKKKFYSKFNRDKEKVKLEKYTIFSKVFAHLPLHAYELK